MKCKPLEINSAYAIDCIAKTLKHCQSKVIAIQKVQNVIFTKNETSVHKEKVQTYNRISTNTVTSSQFDMRCLYNSVSTSTMLANNFLWQ